MHLSTVVAGFAVFAVNMGSLSHAVSAQEMAMVPLMQVVPMYGYSPDMSGPTRDPQRRDWPRYGGRVRSYEQDRYGRGYPGPGMRRSPSYGYRYYAPDRYAVRPRPDQRADTRYSGRIVGPTWSGQWRDLGPVYQGQRY
jgi:hypothetical protein